MTVLERLEEWRTSGAITADQYAAIAAIERRETFSVFVELNVLLYAGVVAAVAGLAWTIQTHFSRIGDAAIVISLTMLCGGAFYYCLARARPFTRERTESPTLGFDYVLYLAALTFGLELAYIESRFALLEDHWDYYLLLSAVVLFPVAYRFDNRLVLSLALSSLAGWFGLSLSRYNVMSGDTLRASALVYGAVVGLTGAWLSLRVGIKRHFLRSYLHIAVNAVLLALLSGVVESQHRSMYLLVLLLASAVAIYGGVRFQEFAFAAYGTLYGYVGISARVLDNVRAMTVVLWYIVLSGTAAIALLVWLSRMGRRR
jgi:hypothetical protein